MELLNSLVAGGGGGAPTNTNTAVAADGVTRAPLNLDSAGRLIVDIGSSIQLDNITVNTDQIEGKIDTSNALLTTIQADLAAPLPLPTGAATSANQTTANSSLSTIATNTGRLPTLVSGRTPVDGSGVTQPISATALPLPTGAATAANQISGGPQLGSGVVTSTTQRVTLATDGPEVTNSTAIKNNTANIPAKGAATIANSTPVNIASDQTVPVSLSSVPSHNVTNAGTFAVQNTAAIPAGTNAIGSITNTAFTANAGTNLNTSALALESGGNLATIATNTGHLTDGTQTTAVIIPASFKTGQAKIAVTGTAVQLASNTLTQGVLISSLASNVASITIGTSSSLTNVVDGTGNGAILTAGSTKSIAATNTNLIWINGTAGDIISFIGS